MIGGTITYVYSGGKMEDKRKSVTNARSDL